MFTESTSSNPDVVVLDDEYIDLSDIICGSQHSTAGITLLWRELGRATLAPRTRAPTDLVRMGSRVHYTDLDRRESRLVHLVYPDEAAAPVFVSVTSSIGAALLGLRAGDRFSWIDPAGAVRMVRIDKVEPPLRPRIRKRRA